MNCRQVKENLSAYLDGMLDENEQAEVKKHLEGCSECLKEYEALKKTVAVLSSLEELIPPADFRRKLRKRLEQGSAKKRNNILHSLAGRLKGIPRSTLIPVAAAFVILLVIIPLSRLPIGGGMGLSSRVARDMDTAKSEEIMYQSSAGVPQSAPAADNGFTEDGANRILGQKESIAEVRAGESKVQYEEYERKIIKNADVTLDVEDYSYTVAEIKDKVMIMNGYIVNENTSVVGPEEILRGHLQVRVPQMHFEDMLEEMDVLGKVKNRNIYAQDVTEEYVDIDSRLKALQTKEERLLAILSKSGELSDILAVENELANTRAQLESLTGRLRYLDNRTEFSTIGISIQQVQSSTTKITATGLSGVMIRAKEAFIRAINNILLFIGKLVVFVGAALPYLVIIVLLGGCGFWFLKKRKKE